jgi:hypothetical protein
MQFLGWFKGGKPELVPLNANRFLEMMSITAVSWLLLEQAMLAEAKLAKLSEGDADYHFYLGKRFAALHYSNLELPSVPIGAEYIGLQDRSPLDIPDAAFTTLEL